MRPQTYCLKNLLFVSLPTQSFSVIVIFFCIDDDDDADENLIQSAK